MTHGIRHFFRWTIKVIQYARILWQDVDHDYSSILTLLQYKLSRVRKHIVSHNIRIDAKEAGEQISLAEELIKRIVSDNYCGPEYDELMRKFGWNFNELPKEVQEQRTTEYHKLSDRIVEKQNKDWNTLWSLLRDKLRDWWC